MIPAFRDVPRVFTIHNMGYQGLFPPDTLPLLMLPWDLFTIGKLEFYGKVNFLKGALVLSDFITTVSRKYGQEIQTAEFGFGLEGVLHSRAPHRRRHSERRGLRRVESRRRTPIIAAHYSPDDLEGKLLASKTCWRSSASTAAEPDLPVIGIVSRFAAQKGFDLIAQVADRLAHEDLIIVALGTGDQATTKICSAG